MNNYNGEDQAQPREEMALAVTHEICCSVCGRQQWYEYQMNRLTEAVAIAQAQAQAEAAYSRQLHSERQILQIAFGEAINRMCRVRQRLERNNNRQTEMLEVGYGPYHGIPGEVVSSRNQPTTPPASPVGVVGS
ncbi:hypothetical protein V3C99_017231 [Haemonchus contortus]|uniref:LOB domain-containing protein n=1 Tax=Haemonchus contortus TaxID=6289 RepID=A0A7I4Z6N2_HAECO